MTITRIIEVGDYKFELILQSKSTHAHSMMTDRTITLSTLIDEFKDNLEILSLTHKEEKKL